MKNKYYYYYYKEKFKLLRSHFPHLYTLIAYFSHSCFCFVFLDEFKFDCLCDGSVS